MKTNVLFITGDSSAVDSYGALNKDIFNITTVSDLSKVLSTINDGISSYDVIVTDLTLGDAQSSGTEILERAKKLTQFPPECIVLLDRDRVDQASECLKSGAFAFVEKGRPETAAILGGTVEKAAHYHNLIRERQSKSVLSNMSEALIKASESRDPFRYRHSSRITKWAVLVGKRMGLTRQQLSDLEVGARLRNIGLALIPDIIITKPGRRTDEEKKLLEEHPRIGYDIAKDIPFISDDVLDAILYHHEMYDGSGFPMGLSGREIPLYAMITRVAIDFEHAFSPPDNRAIRDPERAKNKIIKSAKSGVLDPEVVDYFIQVYDDGDITKIDPLSHSDELFTKAKEEAKVNKFIEVRRYCDDALAEINREHEFFGAFFCIAIGDLFFEYKQYKDASDYYKKAIKLRPGYAEAFYKRGLAFEQQEMWERADWHYSVATSMIPTYIEAHLSRGQVLYKGGFLDEAMKSFERVINFAPDLAAAYLGRGRIFHERCILLNEKGLFTNASESKINARGNYEKARGLMTVKNELDQIESELMDEIIQALESLEQLE